MTYADPQFLFYENGGASNREAGRNDEAHTMAAHLTLEDLTKTRNRYTGTIYMSHDLLPSAEEMITSKHYWRVFVQNDGFGREVSINVWNAEEALHFGALLVAAGYKGVCSYDERHVGGSPNFVKHTKKGPVFVN